jgi:hypothetical protein
MLGLICFLATFVLSDVMDREQMHKTGIDTLNHKQKAALEAWLNDNFVLKNPTSEPAAEVLLSQNLEGGRKLMLTDGNTYEVNPVDLNKSALWITPFTIRITSSNDPAYPILLTNELTTTSVRARLSTPAPKPTSAPDKPAEPKVAPWF